MTRTRGRRQAVAIGVLALLVASTSAIAATYRWTDDKGRVHYSDNPPVEVEAERLGPALPSATAPELDVDKPGTAGDPASKALEEDAARRAAEQKAYEESEAQIAATKRRNCQTARSNLRKLQADEVMVPSAEGGRKLSDGERQRMIRDNRTRISENCTP